MRVSVLAALGVTLWLAGPRALAVVRAKVARAGTTAAGATVYLDRVGFGQRPGWLDRDLLLAVMRDLEPRLQGQMSIMDDAAATALQRSLAASPWVERVVLQRVFPDRLRTELQLRRPVLAVCTQRGAAPEVLVDRQGVCLPAVAVEHLPYVVIEEEAQAPADQLIGKQHGDLRVQAAAAVAVEWRDELCPLVAAPPTLVEVDASNLGYRYIADGRWAEVQIGVARSDGGVAYLAYGHPPGSAAPRVPVQTKARVLTALLAEHPGLVGVDGGDLRFANRWRDWVRPRPAAAQAR